MKVVKIDHVTLLSGVLLPVIVERTFRSLPAELQEIYISNKTPDRQLEVGLNMKLGFYIIERLPGNKVQLLWWEYSSFKSRVMII